MDIIGLGVLLVLALVFAFLALRSWRAWRLWVKLLAGIPTTLLTVLCVAGLGLAVYGYSKVNRTYTNPVANITVAGHRNRSRVAKSLRQSAPTATHRTIKFR